MNDDPSTDDAPLPGDAGWMALIYPELRAMAGRLASDAHATLNPTALVHEVYLKLSGHDDSWEGRRHFLSVAARAMRQVLISAFREKNAAKRGGGRQPVTLTGSLLPGGERPIEFLALDEALDRLAALDERQARLVELRFFGGLTMDEVAAALNVSKTTAENEWRHARAWLEVELRAES